MTEFKYCVYCDNEPAICFESEAEAMKFAREDTSMYSNVKVEKSEIDEDGDILNTEVLWTASNKDKLEEKEVVSDNEFETDFPESDINDIDGSDDTDYDEIARQYKEDPTDWLDDNKLIKEAVDALEENEDEVECKVCFELGPKAEMKKLDIGYVCPKCAQELQSHQGTNLDLIDKDPFDLEYDDPRDFDEPEEIEVKEEPVDANEVRKFEASIEEKLEEHINDRPADIESDQELQGADNAVVDCEVAKVIAHSEDEKPLDCKMEKPALEEPLAGEEADVKLYEDTLEEAPLLKSTWIDQNFGSYKVYTRDNNKGEDFESNFKKFTKVNDAIGFAKNESKKHGIDAKIILEKNSEVLAIFREGKPIKSNIDQILKNLKADNKADKFANRGEDGADAVKAEEPAEEKSDEEPKVEEPVKTTKLDKANKNKKIRKALRNAGISDSEISSDTITTVRKELFGESLSDDEIKELDKEVETLEEELKVIVDFSDYKPWSGAVDTYELIKDADKLDDLEAYLEECYPDGITATQINDILWFDGDQVLSYLGLGDAEDEEVDESLQEAKKDDELPVDPEAAKLEVHTMLNDLVADEIEAINGYEEAKKEILDTPIAHKDNILDTIDHVEDEEKEHVDELIDATTEIPFDKEEAPAPVVEEPVVEKEPLDQDFPEVEEDLEESAPDTPFDSDVKEGDKIRIVHLEGEDNSYDGKEGTIDHIDSLGQLHGTWGGLAVIPGVDDFDIITEEDLNEAKAKPEADKEKTYNDGLKLAKLHNKPVIYGYTNKSYGGKFFALDDPIICNSVSDETKKFKQQYKSCGTVYVAYPDKDFVESLKLSESFDFEDDTPEIFTPEEQEEYNCDEDGNCLDSYDRLHHCGWCGDVFTEYEMRREADFGWLCDRCIDELKSHGGPLTFIEEAVEKKDSKAATDNVDDIMNSWRFNDEPKEKPAYEQPKEIQSQEQKPAEPENDTSDDVDNVMKDW